MDSLGVGSGAAGEAHAPQRFHSALRNRNGGEEFLERLASQTTKLRAGRADEVADVARSVHLSRWPVPAQRSASSTPAAEPGGPTTGGDAERFLQNRDSPPHDQRGPSTVRSDPTSQPSRNLLSRQTGSA
jgi:hypothetical protein